MVCIGIGEVIMEGKVDVFFPFNDGRSEVFISVEDD